jgi:hypothetical protein
VFGVAVAVAVFAATGGYASAGAFTDGFGPAIGVAAALSLAGAAAGLGLPKHNKEISHATSHGPVQAEA